MNINRHNYETFFLLYVDKELSAADRKAVEIFVQENPDLQIELALLQQTVVKADDIVLDKKDWLYMQEDIAALQENLLLYADDELTAADKRSVELLLETDKMAQTEWAILQQTKLQPDTAVVFADKASLYRKEPGRVVAFTWWRVAAAAVLLGFGFFTGVSVYNNYNKTKTGTGELAVEKKEQTGQTKKGDTAITTTPKAEEKPATENIATTVIQKNNQPTSTENIKPAVEKNDQQTPVRVKENGTVQNNNNIKPGNNLPKPYFENINNNKRNETITTNVITENNNSTNVSGNNNAVVQNNTKEKTNNTIVANNAKNGKTEPAAIATLVSNTKTTDGENNNRYLDVDEDKQKRTALGGFLRKAKRVLERTTNVNTGEGIKVAGFEIALK